MTQVTITINKVVLEVEFRYTKGTKSHYDKNFGNWVPGEPEFMDVRRVFLEGSDVDILPLLSEDVTEKIECKLFDLYGSESRSFL